MALGVEHHLRAKHKVLIQLFMARHVMQEEELQRCFKQISEIPDDHNDEGTQNNLPGQADEVLEISIERINRALKLAEMGIRHGVYDVDGKTYYALVNLENDDVSKKITSYKPNETEIFRKTFTEIANSETGTVDDITVFNLRGKESIDAVRDLVQRWINEKWLQVVKQRPRTFTLGPRAHLELFHQIRESGVPECTICHVDVLFGENCKNGSCSVRLHAYCRRRWMAGRASQCPSCSTVWEEDD